METAVRQSLVDQQSKTANGLLLKPPPTKARRPKSADSNTKPLRSSPLAGPALNDQHLLTPPLCHLHPSLDSSIEPFCDPCSSPSLRNKSHSLITGGIRSSGRTQSLCSEHPPSSFTRPAAALPEWEIDPFQGPIQQRSPKSRLRPNSSSGISFRRPIPIVEEEVDEVEFDPTSNNRSTSEFTHSRSISLNRDNSWYTVNPYDVTPRFSRLGLSNSTVVMPLSPKEHRRLSRNPSTKNNSDSATTTRRFSIISALSPKSPMTPDSPPNQSPQLSRTTSISSSTSSIISTPQRETPTPVSIYTSAPSLTQSRDSGDSTPSTSYESLPPTTPPLECDTVLSTREACVREKGKVDGEFRGLDRHHDQIHYSDVIVKKNDDIGPKAKEPGPNLERYPDSQLGQRPISASTTLPTMKKGRDSQRNNAKLQPVDFDDLENPLMTVPKITTEMCVGQGSTLELSKVLAPAIPETIPAVVPPHLSTPTLKKKPSMFKTIFKSFIGKR